MYLYYLLLLLIYRHVCMFTSFLPCLSDPLLINLFVRFGLAGSSLDQMFKYSPIHRIDLESGMYSSCWTNGTDASWPNAWCLMHVSCLFIGKYVNHGWPDASWPHVCFSGSTFRCINYFYTCSRIWTTITNCNHEYLSKNLNNHLV